MSLNYQSWQYMLISFLTLMRTNMQDIWKVTVKHKRIKEIDSGRHYCCAKRTSKTNKQTNDILHLKTITVYLYQQYCSTPKAFCMMSQFVDGASYNGFGRRQDLWPTNGSQIKKHTCPICTASKPSYIAIVLPPFGTRVTAKRFLSKTTDICPQFHYFLGLV